MKEGQPTPEKLYSEHKGKAGQLEQDQKRKENLDRSNPVSRLIAAISGKRKEIGAAVKKSQEEYNENLCVSEEHAGEAHKEAKEHLESYKIYKTEQDRLIQELGPQHAERVESMPWPSTSADMGGYMEELRKLKNKDGVSLEEQARMTAALDIFNPKMDNPGHAGQTFMIGEEDGREEVGIRNGARFPRWELGQDDIQSAAEIARKNNWKNVLEISTTVTAPKKNESDEPYIIGEKNVYVAVSDETAQLLEQTGSGNLDSSSSLHGGFQGEKGYTGKLNTRFKIVDVKQVSAEKAEPESA